MSAEDDSFLSRWSQRKQSAAVEAPAPPPEPEAAEEAPELSEDAWLAAHDLPAPEALKEGDDFAAFLKDGVPDLLRRRALRQLWRSNPALANLDGLLEYGEDYTDAATVPAVLATAYKVGKGILRDLSAEEEPNAVADNDTTEENEAPERETAAGHPAPSDDEPPVAAVEKLSAAEPDAPVEPDASVFAPRRMAFKPDAGA